MSKRSFVCFKCAKALANLVNGSTLMPTGSSVAETKLWVSSQWVTLDSILVFLEVWEHQNSIPSQFYFFSVPLSHCPRSLKGSFLSFVERGFGDEAGKVRNQWTVSSESMKSDHSREVFYLPDWFKRRGLEEGLKWKNGKVICSRLHFPKIICLTAGDGEQPNCWLELCNQVQAQHHSRQVHHQVEK